MVVRHGSVVAERWWRPYAANAPHLLYSLSKSFTSTALGFAVTEGRIDLDATVLSYFPELDAQITDPRSRATQVGMWRRWPVDTPTSSAGGVPTR